LFSLNPIFCLLFDELPASATGATKASGTLPNRHYQSGLPSKPKVRLVTWSDECNYTTVDISVSLDRHHQQNKSADNVSVAVKTNVTKQTKSILRKLEHYSTCSNLKARPEDMESLLPQMFESPQSVHRDQMLPSLGVSPSAEKNILFDKTQLLSSASPEAISTNAP